MGGARPHEGAENWSGQYVSKHRVIRVNMVVLYESRGVFFECGPPAQAGEPIAESGTVWRLILHARPRRARLHVAGAEVCVFACGGCTDAMEHCSVCELLWPLLFYSFRVRGDPCLAVAMATAASGSEAEIRAATAVMCAASEAYHVARHLPRRRSTAMRHSLRACMRAVRERAWDL